MLTMLIPWPIQAALTLGSAWLLLAAIATILITLYAIYAITTQGTDAINHGPDDDYM